ncbi:hypothetical protein G7046_g1560 [Stylonectria norvegica]|nr:hypothetical protein G7046_g1560 [Stylonectria norvegica]
MTPSITHKPNSKSPTIRRIRQLKSTSHLLQLPGESKIREAAEISNSPSADYTAEPLESDFFEWHFTLRGPPSSVYSNGIYHGRIVLPPTYPLRPPSFRFTTPSGRFEANREICLSISGHHEETWQPAWGVRTALVALRSFMETDAKGQLGGIDTTDGVRQRLANESPSFKCQMCGKTNAEIMKECEQRAQEASSSSQEIEIPKELKMGYKDEMEAQKNGANVESSKDEHESAELAEGFVQTAPDASNALPPAASTEEGTAAPSRPDVPVPTRTRPLAAAAPVAVGPRYQPAPVALQQRQPRPASDDGVPLWIDRTIVVLVVLLFALVLKILFSV